MRHRGWHSASCSGRPAALRLCPGRRTRRLPPARRFVADDDARMRRQARSRAVGPEDGVARQQAPPSVIAGHVGTLAGAGLRQRRPGAADGDRRDEKSRTPAPDRWSCRPPPVGLSHQSIVVRHRFSVQWPENAKARRRRKCQITQAIQLFAEISAITAAVTCKSRPAPSRE